MEISGDHRIIHKELLEACKKGDPKAQMKIYKLYYKPMYNISLRILGDTMEAEDVMQESFLAAFRTLAKTELNISFGGWLKRIVVNRSLDALRQRKVSFEVVDNLPDYSEVETVYDPEAESTEEKIGRVRRAIERLPEKYRVVISLNLFEGYDHDEIGQILGVPASTSRAHLSRGKQKLMQMLTA
jgi:RNA polymerase sigma-70 factor (ECF subfamily)